MSLGGIAGGSGRLQSSSMPSEKAGFLRVFRVFWDFCGSRKSTLTLFGNCHILPASRTSNAAFGRCSTACSPSRGESSNLQAAIHVDGSALGRRLRLSADREGCRRHGGRAVLFDYLPRRKLARPLVQLDRPRRRGGSGRRMGGANPIAPGNAGCPLPPWDMAFPGAFLCALRGRGSGAEFRDACEGADAADYLGGGASLSAVRSAGLSVDESAMGGGA